MTQKPDITGLETYNIARDGFLHELRGLIGIIQSSWFREIIPIFLNYGTFLKTGRHGLYTQDSVESLLKNYRVIDAANCPINVKKVFFCANIAACCEIFCGWTIPVSGLEITRANEYLAMGLANTGADKVSLGRSMGERLNNGDTVRVVQMLKLLGLLEADITSCHQVSLGASFGNRDCRAMHLEPSIIPTGVITASVAMPPLRFTAKPGSPKDIVLMDNDPTTKSVYEQLNAEGQGSVKAITADLYEGLDWLTQQVENRVMPPRTMVVAYRIEPRAFPDIEQFLDSIGNVIADSADLVMTIGSGDTTEEFRHRIDVLEGIYRNLADKGMNPLRIKYYSGVNTEEQRASPVFGLNQYASYETLYCKLDKRRL